MGGLLASGESTVVVGGGGAVGVAPGFEGAPASLLPAAA
jgi:hypothetical protein